MCLWNKDESQWEYPNQVLTYGMLITYIRASLVPECQSGKAYGDRIKVGFQLFVELEEDSEKIHNIIHHQTNLEPSKLFLFQNHEHTKTRGSRSYRLKKHLFSSNRLFNSLCNRAVDCWNALTEDLVTAGSYKRFCSKIRKLDITKFVKGL